MLRSGAERIGYQHSMATLEDKAVGRPSPASYRPRRLDTGRGIDICCRTAQLGTGWAGVRRRCHRTGMQRSAEPEGSGPRHRRALGPWRQTESGPAIGRRPKRPAEACRLRLVRRRRGQRWGTRCCPTLPRTRSTGSPPSGEPGRLDAELRKTERYEAMIIDRSPLDAFDQDPAMLVLDLIASCADEVGCCWPAT